MTTVTKPVAAISALTIAGRVGWLTAWGVVTAIAGLEIASYGSIDGSAWGALMLAALAFGAFILPDLTFLVGWGQPTDKGYLPIRAVPSYNALHRFWPPLLLTTVVGIGLAPLSTGGVALFVVGLSWMAHVALDRAAGYGLRNADGSR